MARKLKYDMPGPDWRRSIDEVRERGWEGVFAPELAPPLRLVVEIGFGRGEFLVAQAAARPDVAFVGVELSFKRVLKLARRMARGELRNARLVLGRGETVVDELLAPASVDEFWINFPDPWPKKRHAKNRLVQPPLVHALATRLVPGGVLHAATDDPAYAEQMDEVFAGEPLLENANAPLRWRPEVPGRMHTAYEEQWRAEGRPLHFFAYRRRA
ncbi:MAG: tRNA (guanosine(46)-N7)-methyltransferase TrmB [Myxococcota bacterium]|nr:tRNA (guanosine(46)-N7)-methyltransferase TrmB [Myxococcales bacterium]